MMASDFEKGSVEGPSEPRKPARPGLAMRLYLTTKGLVMMEVVGMFVLGIQKPWCAWLGP